MSGIDEQALRDGLREQLASLEISPPPIVRVTRRGRGIRARRRLLTGGSGAAAVLAVVLAAQLGGGRVVLPAITQNPLNHAAPGGVFASGRADGKPWRLAVRNIAGNLGGPWCLPAVMFNGRDGDVLFKVRQRALILGNPAFLTGIAGFPGVGAAFTQVAPGTTRLVLTFPDGKSITARPVRVRACGTSFNLAGLAFSTRRSPGEIATYDSSGLSDGLVLSPGIPLASLYPPPHTGIWENLDKSRADIAASEAANPIGTGTADGEIWHIRASLGLFGQCYTATLRDTMTLQGNRGRGQGSECVPVSAPPRSLDLASMAVQSPRIVLPGYAGLVSPRTAYVIANIDNGTTERVVPVRVAGRAYIAFVVPPGCMVTWLSLFDASGHVFANNDGTPAARPIPGLPPPPSSAGSS